MQGRRPESAFWSVPGWPEAAAAPWAHGPRVAGVGVIQPLGETREGGEGQDSPGGAPSSTTQMVSVTSPGGCSHGMNVPGRQPSDEEDLEEKEKKKKVVNHNILNAGWSTSLGRRLVEAAASLLGSAAFVALRGALPSRVPPPRGRAARLQEPDLPQPLLGLCKTLLFSVSLQEIPRVLPGTYLCRLT